METLTSLKKTSIDMRIVFWPSLADMLTSVLMVFLLVYFLQVTLGMEDLEAQNIRRNQDTFTSDFQKSFAREMADKSVNVRQELNLIQITFSDKVLFESGQYLLEPRGKEVLRRCSDIFRRSSGLYRQIQVEGHTDDQPVGQGRGYPHDNWELSTGRAISVVKFFTDEAQLDPRLFSANGYSFYRPADPAHPDDRAKNRRIEIRIVFATPQ